MKLVFGQIVINKSNNNCIILFNLTIVNSVNISKMDDDDDWDTAPVATISAPVLVDDDELVIETG